MHVKYKHVFYFIYLLVFWIFLLLVKCQISSVISYYSLNRCNLVLYISNCTVLLHIQPCTISCKKPSVICVFMSYYAYTTRTARCIILNLCYVMVVLYFIMLKTFVFLTLPNKHCVCISEK